MPSTSAIYDSLGPAHVLIFGTSLGAQLFQSFISGPISYSVLPRQHFSLLQSRTFPTYFTLQTLTAPLLLLTLPRSPETPLLDLIVPSSNPSWSTTALPIAIAFVTSATNLLFVGPHTTNVMNERRKVLDGMQGGEGGEIGKVEGGEKLKGLNKKFARAHGTSTVLNLIGIVSVGVVGWGIGKRLN